MGHVPHLYVPGPWREPTIEPARESVEHLDRVLRIRSGETVSYTDGAGTVGEGIWESSGLRRGPERTLSRPSPDLTMAVAAPRSAARQRFVVEKLAELGARRLVWLETDLGSGHARKPEKVRAWTIAALEQSRGAHLLEVGDHEQWEDLERPLFVAIPGAGALADVAVPPSLTLAIGPEGGFAADEVPADAHPVGLGNSVLRVETVAVAAAALLLAR